MQFPRRRWITVAVSAPLILIVALILVGSGLSPQRAWAQTESAIASPAPGSTVSGTVSILGTAVDPNFARYELAYKPEPSGEEAYIYLSEGAEQVIDGQLGVWQTDNLAPGQYSLRMRVVRTDGNYAETFALNLTVGQGEELPAETPTETATALPATATPIPAQPTQPPATAVAQPVAATATPIVAATPVVTPTIDTSAVTTTVAADATPTITPVSVNVVGGDEASLRIFLRSLLASLAMGPATEAITATVGTLPSLPIDLDLPASVAVVGSVARIGEFGGTQLFFAAPPSVADLTETVREQLIDQGFTLPAASGTSGVVFLSTQPDFSLLCSADDELSVNLGTAALNNTILLQVNLSPIRPDGDPCTPDATQPAGLGDGVLPQLQPLTGALVQGSGGSSSGSRISATADIQTELTADVIAAHYEDQLEAAGWERIDDTAADAIAWSAWTFTDEDDNEWSGTFYIVRLAGDGSTFVATLDAERQR
jgi:hypothetical protein